MLIGSLGTLQQKKIKRLLAYSSITHVGFILIGFVSNELFNISFIIFYIGFYWYDIIEALMCYVFHMSKYFINTMNL